MASYVQNLLNNTLGDGARSTKFECIINFNTIDIYGKKDILTLVKTSQFPGKSHDVIDFKYKGRNIPLKGQVKYDNTWDCTFYLTQDHELKGAFEDWIESLDQKHNIKEVSPNVKTAQIDNNSENGFGYNTSLKIMQMDFDGTQQTAVYELFNVFPKNVSLVNVDYSALGEVLEFTVSFAYSHYNLYTVKSADGSFIDTMKSNLMESVTNFTQNIKDQITDTIASGIKTVSETIKDNIKDNEAVTFSADKMATKVEW